MLKGLCDRNRLLCKIKIVDGQGQCLALTKSAPIEHLKIVVPHRIIHHVFREFQIFLTGPAFHFNALFTTHISNRSGRVFRKLVVTDRMVEDRAQLVMNRFQVGFGIGLAILGIPVIQQLILPKHNIFCSDFTHTFFAEVRDQLGVNNIVFH